MQVLDVGEKFLEALNDPGPASGMTHGYYRYPARFSPQFVRRSIEAFSDTGDLVVDPFMGGGTTLVECLALGRRSIGLDVNPLSVFVARSKTTLLGERAVAEIRSWWEETEPKLNLHRPSERSQPWADEGYQKDIPWPIRKMVEILSREIGALSNHTTRQFARCLILKTSQWAVDGRKNTPSAAEFRERMGIYLEELIAGNNELYRASKGMDQNVRFPLIGEARASELPTFLRKNGMGKAKLVITSPPYPGVHVLYHRWQVHGRRETPAPYWIIDSPDGHGGSFYTMGSRTDSGIDDYFDALKQSFYAIRSAIRPDGIMVQLVSFSDRETQFDRYMHVMDEAGFSRKELRVDGTMSGATLSREVPNRKWHATLAGNTDASTEHLLIHVPE